MNIIKHRLNDKNIAEITADDIIIKNTSDALDIMAEAGSDGTNRMILYEKNLTPEFFILRTGIAGEILQKYVNYNVKLAIIGDFTRYNSKSLNDFIYECNKGNQLFFFEDVETAKMRLSQI